MGRNIQTLTTGWQLLATTGIPAPLNRTPRLIGRSNHDLIRIRIDLGFELSTPAGWVYQRSAGFQISPWFRLTNLLDLILEVFLEDPLGSDWYYVPALTMPANSQIYLYGKNLL